ncbi:unnamed protein product, partial [Effrenium voratum]
LNPVTLRDRDLEPVGYILAKTTLVGYILAKRTLAIQVADLHQARFGDVLGSGGREPLAGAKTSTCRSSRSGSNSCYWGLCGWAPVRIGVNSAFEQCFRLCFDIEAYCPCIFGNRDLVEPGTANF